MANNIHDLGDLVRVSATFKDAETEDELDPTEVSLSVCTPDGEVVTYVYDTDAEVVKEDVGMYYADLDANQTGTWFYRWWSTGTGQASEEGRFTVRGLNAI